MGILVSDFCLRVLYMEEGDLILDKKRRAGEPSTDEPVQTQAQTQAKTQAWTTHHRLDATTASINTAGNLNQVETVWLAMKKARRSYSVGEVVDNTYRLLAVLGEGGMGVVFHCQHLILGKEYALKLLASEQLSDESWSRFQVEAKALARLNHPAVVAVHNMGVDKGECPYYVMDYIDGQSLAQLIKSKKRLTVKEALSIFIQLADALGAAHQQGIIHRDIKPSNVMVSENGGYKVKLVDFGIARLSNSGIKGQVTTAAGTVFGTPYYMSPEQGLGRKVDGRADIYSLGCALFEALTSIPPFCGANAMETLILHQTEDAPLLSEVYVGGNFSPDLNRVVARMLKRAPEERYASMQEVRRDLIALRDGTPLSSSSSSSMASRPGASAAPVYSNSYSLQESPLVAAAGKSSRASKAEQSAARIKDPEQEQGQGQSPRKAKPSSRRGSLVLTLTAAFACLVFLSLGLIYVLPQLRLKNSDRELVSSAVAVSGVDGDDDNDEASTAMLDPFAVYVKRFKKFLGHNPMLCSRTVDINGMPIKRFIFPGGGGPGSKENLHVGWMRTSDGLFHPLTDTIDLPAADKTTIFLQCICTPYADIYKRFGTGNLSGFEMVSFDVPATIASVKGDKALKRFSLFNSVERADGIDCSPVMKEHLPLLDELSQLTSLGISGELYTGKQKSGTEITGADIASMHLLNSLEELSLQEVRDIRPLLEELSHHPNIKKLSLIRLDLTDADIAVLSRNRYLEEITIFKNPGITPASAASFSRMPALRSLHMDNAWLPADKTAFSGRVRAYAFEDYKIQRHN